ncbi:MAG: histidine kinase [Solirubrobacterales bacterium]|nr:histidine kinase [Solirubrobacterales bacterium]
MTVRRRLVTSTALIALVAVLVLGVPLALVEAARVRTDQTARLEREADAVAAVIDDRLEAGKPIRAALLRRHVVRGHQVTVTLVNGSTIAAGSTDGGAMRRVHAGSSRNSTVTAAAPLSEENHRVHRAWALLILLAGGGVAFAVVLASIQARRLSAPLERVALTSARLGDGDFSVRAPRSGVPEIDAIAQALDRSAERIARLVAREREFSSNVSHQLRTPLTALRLRMEELAQVDEPAAREREAAAALREADRLEATIVNLLAHAREDRVGRAAQGDVVAIARDHVARWAPIFGQDLRVLTLTCAGHAYALVSPGTVGQILDVLLENAGRHGSGAVTVDVKQEDGHALISVKDDGAGIAREDYQRVFERGASGGGGTGIGLHLARALAEADGASLRVATTCASRLELRLPLATTPGVRAPGAVGPA